MELLTTPQAAEYLNVPEGTLRYWRVCGRGPRAVKIGKRVMYRREALATFVDDHEQREEVDR